MIFTSHYKTLKISEAKELKFQSPLARRMSPLAKVVMELFTKISLEDPKFFEYCFKEMHYPIYFATSLGEVQSIIQVISGVIRKDLPVSPTAFQNSVHNSSIGYFSIHYKTHDPVLTFTSGYLSLDKAIYSAFHKIKSQMIPGVCIVGASEEPLKDNQEAFAEIIFLHGNFPKPDYEITAIEYGADISSNYPVVEYKLEKDYLDHAPLELSKFPYSFVRKVQDLNSEKVVSVWKRI